MDSRHLCLSNVVCIQVTSRRPHMPTQETMAVVPTQCFLDTGDIPINSTVVAQALTNTNDWSEQHAEELRGESE